MSSLSVQNACKTFAESGGAGKTVLNGLNLEAADGDFITILGSNGAGKSTLFNAILGKFLLDDGAIVLGTEDLTFKKEHSRALNIGCLYQNPMRGTAPSMTLEENLALAYTRKASKSFFAVNKRDSAFFAKLLAELDMGLEKRLKTPIGQLSGGQRQAASLLMSTISQPKLLLLDEHTAALDPAAALKVLNLTDRIITRDRITTLMITHDMNYALKHGNRTILMDAGRVALDISGEERRQMTPAKLVELFGKKSGAELANDRMLLS